MLLLWQSFWTVGTMAEAALASYVLIPWGWRWLLGLSALPFSEHASARDSHADLDPIQPHHTLPQQPSMTPTPGSRPSACCLGRTVMLTRIASSPDTSRSSLL